MFTKNFDRRVYVAVSVFAFAGALGCAFGMYVLWPSHREAGYMPEQPIPYSHKLHPGDLKMECLYCHTNADKGTNATTPPVSTCMKCHEEVQTKDENGNLKPGIAALLDQWKRNEPVRWNKVSTLADFVYFDHSRHVNSDILCQECHGPVETFEHMYRYRGMKMSWCLNCHRKKVSKQDATGRTVETLKAPINCSTCHR